MIDKQLLTRPSWQSPPGIRAFTTQMAGGVSLGQYQSLNLGLHVGDEAVSVMHNRSILPFANNIHWLEQTHSDIAIALPNASNSADAAFTSSVDIVCAVMTADCLPILLTDINGEVVCAVHAGWKGLVNQIIAKTIAQAFDGVPSHRIIAWIGPSIKRCHYEVDRALAEQFSEYDNAFSISQNGDKAMLDLTAIATQQLIRSGVTHLSVSHECTYCLSKKYFSYRRASHQGLSDCGRMATIIIKLK